MNHLQHRSAAAVALLACAALLAACGGGSSDGEATANTTGDNAQDQARVDFAKCMRENGVDVPDDPGQRRIPRDLSQDKLQRAMQACRKHLQDAARNISAEDREAFRDAQLKFAQCLRSEGLDVPDPGANGTPGGFLGSIDRDSPQAREALEACQDELPQGRFGRGGGGNG